jgi:hypothetical protein
VSVEETLTDLKVQYLDGERRRAAGGSGEVGVGGVSPLPQPSGSAALGVVRWDSTAHPADRSAATTILQQHQMMGVRRERRRTVTDIWPKD